MELSDDEKETFLLANKVSGVDQIKLAEGNPHQSSNMEVKVPDSLVSLFKNAITNPGTSESIEGEDKN
jgi:hypothetical protein